MNDPIVYVSTWRIREGEFEEYRRFYAELVKIVDENEPGVAAFLAFANDEATEITNVHVYPDRATLDRHMAVLGEKVGLLPADLTAVMAYLEPVSVQVYGTPGGQAAEMDQGLIDSGVPFAFKRRYLGGFARQRAS
jgi:quinol monooxygenase YgiN